MEKELLDIAELLRPTHPAIADKLENLAGLDSLKPDLSNHDRPALRHLKKRVRKQLINSEPNYRGIPTGSWVLAIEEREKELGVGAVGKAPKSLI